MGTGLVSVPIAHMGTSSHAGPPTLGFCLRGVRVHLRILRMAGSMTTTEWLMVCLLGLSRWGSGSDGRVRGRGLHLREGSSRGHLGRLGSWQLWPWIFWVGHRGSGQLMQRHHLQPSVWGCMDPQRHQWPWPRASRGWSPTHSSSLGKGSWWLQSPLGAREGQLGAGRTQGWGVPRQLQG